MLLILLLSSCAGGGVGQPGQAPDASEPVRQGAIRGTGGYSLDVLPETFDGGAQTGVFTLDVQPSDGGTVVRVLGMGLSGLRGFYGQLYCPAGSVVETAQAGTGLGRPGEVLSLCCGESGVVELGAVQLHCDTSAGINGAAELARVVLRRGNTGVVRRASSVPARTAASAHCWINCTTKRLEWDARLPGDYNQDGRVAVTDLTPLAVHWGEAPVAFPDSVARYVVDSIQEVVDGNADEALGIGDLTVIGQWAGSQTGGWNLYRSLDPGADFPDVELDDPLGDGAAPSKIARFAYRAYGVLAVADATCERQRFSIDLPLLTDGMAYWVRPVTGGVEGTPSNWSPYDKSLAQEISWDTNPESYMDTSAGTLDFELSTLGPDVIEGVLWAHAIGALRIITGHAHFDGTIYDGESYPEGLMARDLTGGVFEIHNCIEAVNRLMICSHKGYYDTSLQALSGTFPTVRLRFSHRAQQDAAVPVVMPARPISPELVFNTGNSQLTWYYTGIGDGNQDGFIWFDDLIPIGIHLGEVGQFDSDSPLCLIDANGNGGCEIYDLAYLGVYNFTAIYGYNIYATLDAADAPVAGDMPAEPGIAPVGYVSITQAQGDRNTKRLHFSFTVPAPQSGMYLWVQQESCGANSAVRQGQYVQIP